MEMSQISEYVQASLQEMFDDLGAAGMDFNRDARDEIMRIGESELLSAISYAIRHGGLTKEE